MLKEVKTEKETQSESGQTTEATTKSGLFFMLTRLERLMIRVLIKISDSIEIDHSTSDLDLE